MKRMLIICLTCAALIAAFAFSAWAADAPAGPVKIEWKGKTTKSQAAFTHDNHKQDCKVCHHKWDGKAEVQKCTAAGCHDDFKGKRGDASAYAAFHDRKAKTSCIGCHKADKKGPTKCNECHPK